MPASRTLASADGAPSKVRLGKNCADDGQARLAACTQVQDTREIR